MPKRAMTPDERRALAIRLLRDGRAVSTGQAAELLAADVKSVARWCRQKRIACSRTPGGHWRIPAREVARLVLGENQGEDQGDGQAR